MAEVERETTPVGRAMASMSRAFEESAAGRPAYPNGTAFIAADLDGFGECVAQDARDNRPIVIVYPDGEERFLVPTPHPGETA